MHEMAPTTRRSAKLLSRVYGFKTPEKLAESLPAEAAVVDFGAGRSKFGQTIVGLRDDISWINVDPRYVSGPPKRKPRQIPEGLLHIAGDVLDPPFESGTFDRVYSSALLPHIVMTSPVLALRAVHNMATLLKEDAVLSTAGFINSRWMIPPNKVSVVSAEEYNDAPDLVAAQIVGMMILSPGIEMFQRCINMVSHYTGSNRPSYELDVS